jgi:YidC/Oxa1 family membrane protein insertase
MDQKRLFIAIAISIGILLAFDLWQRPQREAQRQAEQQVAREAQLPARPATPQAPATTGAPGDANAAAATARAAAQRLPIDTPRLAGSLSLRGARLDDLVLKTYRDTIQPNSPLVRLLASREQPDPYFAQWGWTAADGRTRVPDSETDWTASAAGPLTPQNPITLRWDNGAGVVFEIALQIDATYMLQAEQRVVNNTADGIVVLPWSRIRREHTPQVGGNYILHEGFVGVLGGSLKEMDYKSVKETGGKQGGVGMQQDSTGGWLGFTDKYWLTALTPVDQAQTLHAAFRHATENGQDRWQADLAPPAPLQVPAGGNAALATRLFAGAKEVAALDDYRDRLGIPNFDKAVDFGWFYFLTKPFFYAIDFLFHLVGNFGVAILIVTFALKLLFFPLANKSYHSMARMKVLAPKMTEIRERYKDDPAKAQSEMMALYKTEKVNPASGCLPILIQIPVFFSLYKVLYVTIEMRHAPFFGWIHDLSAPDPTNLFNLFGLIPFDPPTFLHMPAWAIIMGITMFLQYKLNPTPPDPIQAKLFAFMPLIFTFMLASFPAGLVIYWSWNNLLSISQQAWIMRHDRRARRDEKKGLVKG